MRKFLLDTWYGAFAVLLGVTLVSLGVAVLLARFSRQMPEIVSTCICLPMCLAFLVAGTIFMVSLVRSYVKGLWRRAVLQTFLGTVWLFGLMVLSAGDM